jgi:hypothetical protein
MRKRRFLSATWPFCAFIWALATSSLALAQSNNCEVIDFNEFSHGNPITTLSLFNGALTLKVTAQRNDPADAVDATAYDTERWVWEDDRSFSDPLYPAGGPPPNRTHWDTQVNDGNDVTIACNDAANGGLGTCDGAMAVIPDENFEEDGDDTQGGTITFTSQGGGFEIASYKAVDSDDFEKRIDLFVLTENGFVQVGDPPAFGDGSVITVETEENVTTQAVFEFFGSGGIDDIEICRPAEIGDFVWEDCNGNGIQDDANITGCGLGGGIPGVPVELRIPVNGNCTGAGELIAETTTGTLGNEPGQYLFTDLASGEYCVLFPSRWAKAT